MAEGSIMMSVWSGDSTLHSKNASYGAGTHLFPVEDGGGDRVKTLGGCRLAAGGNVILPNVTGTC